MDIKRVLFYAGVVLTMSCPTIDKTSYVAHTWPPKMVNKALQSTSVIFVTHGDSGALGTGVVISKTGRTLTAAHVVELDSGSKVTMIMQNGNEYEIRVLAIDHLYDLALVEPVASAQSFIYSRLQASDRIDIGQDVLVIGHPFGGYWTVTAGIVSRMAWSWTYFCKIMEIDATVNPGNSGGPVFNTDGDIVGIISAMRMNVFGPTGIGIAIPIRQIRAFLTAYDRGGNKSTQRKRHRIGDVPATL